MAKSPWHHFREREWTEIRDAWLEDIPTFPQVGAIPDPGLENLSSLMTIDLPAINPPYKRHADVEGVRRNALWEAVFLFHKCSHTHLAAQRLGQLGMHSWCMFNAYHSAYLGARGIIATLGIALVTIQGNQTGIDLFIQPESNTKQKALRALASRRFQEFLIVRFPSLIEQRNLWQGLQRILKISTIGHVDQRLIDEVLGLSYESISPPRNRFLYKAPFWPLADLMDDARVEEMEHLVGIKLDVELEGFLLNLSFFVYRIFEQLMEDLVRQSEILRAQIDASRSLVAQLDPELERYRLFLNQLAA